MDSLRDGKIDVLVATGRSGRAVSDVSGSPWWSTTTFPTTPSPTCTASARRPCRAQGGGHPLGVSTAREYLLRTIEKATRQPVEQMRVPTTDGVGPESRKDNFARQIGGRYKVRGPSGLFRRWSSATRPSTTWTRGDQAAALAVIAQTAAPSSWRTSPRCRSASATASARTGRPRSRRSRVTAGVKTYKLAVGRRDRVVPGAVVGALARGRARRRGWWDGRPPAFTLVGLPETCPRAPSDSS
ncbi:hypothetical protein QJS66_19975 [Kocuria rhizophila]|nr:hypothetical protein QJS66_19975 [Kocuria rhizophila]